MIIDMVVVIADRLYAVGSRRQGWVLVVGVLAETVLARCLCMHTGLVAMSGCGCSRRDRWPQTAMLRSACCLLLWRLFDLCFSGQIDHGWKHQDRQWNYHKELKKLGTTFSLGRSVARKRKETIDSYVSRCAWGCVYFYHAT